jgi:Ca-activated chloride channel family protein
LRHKSTQLIQKWFDKDKIKNNYIGLKLLLRAGALTGIIVALAGPFWGAKQLSSLTLGREIYFLVDVSASMNVQDVRPSRLKKVKQELKKLVYAFRGERMGLIVFTNYAYVQCPLTTDYKALQMFLEILETSQFGNTGTDLRAALNSAAERFEQQNSSAKISRYIVLFSDGEDYGGRFQSAINRLKDMGVKIIPVGVGTLKGGEVPEFDSKGMVTGYKKDASGQVVISKLKEDVLKLLASEFRTPYITLDSDAENLAGLAQQLKNLPAGRLENRNQMVENNLYQWVLLISIVCLAVSLFLRPRRITI